MSLTKSKILLSAAVVSAGLFMSGCGDKVATTTSVPPLPTVEAKALTIVGDVVDAKTGSNIDGVTLTFEGTDKIAIETANLRQLSPGVWTVSATKSDISVNVLATKGGYIDTGITLRNADKNSTTFQIRMVSKDPANAPMGVAIKENNTSSADSTGSIGAADLMVSAAVDNDVNTNGEKTELVIPANTRLLDKDRNPVKGTITTTVAHYSAAAQTSANAFPGGFAVLATAQDGNDSNITFETAGFTSINMTDENGIKIRNFEPAVEVRMQLKDTTFNPKENRTIMIGDQVPVWSYNEDTGKWAYEQEGNVTEGVSGDGFYDVVVPVTHLSYWNLDWHYSATCSNVRLELLADGKLATDEVYNMRAAFVNSYGYMYSGTINNDGYANMQRVPLDKPFKVTATDTSGRTGEGVFTITLAQCSTGSVTLPMSVPTPPVKVTETIKVSEACKDGSKYQVIPNMYAWNYVSGKYNGYTHTGNAGTYTITGSEDGPVTVYLDTHSYTSRWVNATNYYSYYYKVDTTMTTGTKEIKFELNPEYCPIDTGATGSTGGVN